MTPQQILWAMNQVKTVDAWLSVDSNRSVTSFACGCAVAILMMIWFLILQRRHSYDPLFWDWMTIVTFAILSIAIGAVACFCVDWTLDNLYFYSHALVVWYSAPLGPALNLECPVRDSAGKIIDWVKCKP